MLGAKRNKTMPDVTFHTAYISALEAEKIHRALVESGHTDIADIMSERSRRTDTDRRYASALELLEEGTFEMDDAPVFPPAKMVRS